VFFIVSDIFVVTLLNFVCLMSTTEMEHPPPPEGRPRKGATMSVRRERARALEEAGGPSRCCRCVGQEQPEAQPQVDPEPEAPPHVGPEPEEEELGEADFAEEEADREGNQHKKLEGPHWAHCSFKEHEPAEFHRGPKHKSVFSLSVDHMTRYVYEGYVSL
jgi:hypothetical protein